MNRRRERLSAVLLVAMLLLGACGQAPASPSASQTQASDQQAVVTVQPPEPTAATTASSGSEGVTITVGTDSDAALLFVPRTVEAPANTPVRLIFNNTSTQPHNLLIPAPISAKTKLIVSAGATDTIEFITPAPGKYRFVCSVHEDEGMVGTLQVK